MGNQPNMDDQAVLYVLGQLPAAERAEFEARLADSAELRALVRELEEGGVAVSMSTPQRRPPPEVWQQIERTVTKESRSSSFFTVLVRGLRSGWAVAAICLVGWLVYAFGVNHAKPPAASELASQPPPSPQIESITSVTQTTQVVSVPGTNVRPPPDEATVQTTQIAVLHRQVTDLKKEVVQLSRALTDQQTIQSNLNQFSFFTLSPLLAEGNAASPPPALSADLQRALLLAVAKELGMQRVLGTNTGVEFVTLRPPGTAPASTDNDTSATLAAATSDTTSTPPTITTEAPPAEFTTNAPAVAAVSGFNAGTNTVLAFDPSALPYGTESLTVWSGSAEHFMSLGSFSIRSSPTVVTIPGGGWLSPITPLRITTGNTFNWMSPSNVIGVFPPQ